MDEREWKEKYQLACDAAVGVQNGMTALARELSSSRAHLLTLQLVQDIMDTLTEMRSRE
jgi:hypothetical protein